MSFAVTATVTGDAALLAKLQTLIMATGGAALGAIVRAGAVPVQNQAKVNAPKDTGTLSRSIHTEVTEQSAARATATVGTDVEYARRVEQGFTGADSLGRIINQSPRPYLRKALDESHDEVRAAMGDAARDVILRAA